MTPAAGPSADDRARGGAPLASRVSGMAHYSPGLTWEDA